VADRLGNLWRRLGFPPALMLERVVLTPACGLAGTDPATARAVLTACREAALRMTDAAHT
jgi:hypothetical protein